jgi:hypothetical protein
MDCPECDEPLDVSATKPNFLRCGSCKLLFVVKEDDSLQPFAVQPPEDADEDEFFASFTRNLGFEDLPGTPDRAPRVAATPGPGAGTTMRLVVIGVAVVVALAAAAWVAKTLGLL